ncbi:hypothetical protein D3C78_1567150 [compost metagenome]
MNRNKVALFKQRLFGCCQRHPHLGGPFCRQVLAPGQHPHTKCLRHHRHLAANLAQPQQAQRLALQGHANRLLPGAVITQAVIFHQ